MDGMPVQVCLERRSRVEVGLQALEEDTRKQNSVQFRAAETSTARKGDAPGFYGVTDSSREWK